MGKYEVTQAQWETVMGNNPSEFKGADRPVEMVPWNDAQAFLKKLNATHPSPLPRGEQRETSLSGGDGGGSGIVVEITDSGGGIPDEIKPRIFEPFFTTKPAGEGSGLGLDICKKIIEKHQGKIEVESQPGRTTFRVWLPQQHE